MVLGSTITGPTPHAAADANGGSGVTGAGMRATTSSLAAASGGTEAAAGTGTIERGREFDAATRAAMKDLAERGASPAPRGIDADGATGVAASAVAAPTLSQSFDTITYNGFLPPDPQIAAGPSDVLVVGNSEFSIYDKTANRLTNQTLLSWFSGVLPADTSNILVYDPWVFYDPGDDRFVMVALAKRGNPMYSRWLVSVSTDDTAQGSWCNWSTSARDDASTQTDNWADYDRAGTTDNTLMLSANMFKFSNGNFQYAKVRYLPKSALYDTSCPSFTYYDYWDLKNSSSLFPTTSFTVIPTHSYFGSSTTSYLINAKTSGNGSDLVLWKTTTANCCTTAPTLTRQGKISTDPYSVPPGARQPGSSTRIDTGDTRLLDAVYRESGIWTAQTTGCDWSGDTETRACARWYQIDPGSLSITRWGDFGASGMYYYFPAIHVDSSENATMVFNRSSSTEFAGIRYTGRRSTDSGGMQSSAQLTAGQGCYARLDSTGVNRWGDYNGIAIDPSNAHVWMSSEYAYGTSGTCGSNVWRMRAGETHW